MHHYNSISPFMHCKCPLLQGCRQEPQPPQGVMQMLPSDTTKAGMLGACYDTTLCFLFPNYKKNSVVNKHRYMFPFVLIYMTCVYMDLPCRKEKRRQSSGLDQKREAERLRNRGGQRQWLRS